MIDLHSHILPAVDDGSRNTQESLKMLRMLKKQGVTKVVATPHFYANRSSVDEFLSNREESYLRLCAELSENMPQIILGAEVKYYEGISRLENLNKLCIGDSKLLLLEMPMRKWTEFILRELRELSLCGNIIIVLAHIERYLAYQNKGTVDELVNDGILIQANANFFINFTSRHKALSMLRRNLIHFIGSDCHNLTDRVPKNCDKIFTTSPSFVGEIKKRVFDNKDKVIYWPQYAEEYYVPAKINSSDLLSDEKRFKVAFTGNIGVAQGLDVLIKASQYLSAKNIKDICFVIIGDGRNKADLMHQIKESGLDDYFVWIDRQPPEKIPSLLSSCDVAFVSFMDNPLFSNTIPAKLQSYLACGMPIVASASGETKRIVEASECGVCSPIGDGEALGENIC